MRPQGNCPSGATRSPGASAGIRGRLAQGDLVARQLHSPPHPSIEYPRCRRATPIIFTEELFRVHESADFLASAEDEKNLRIMEAEWADIHHSRNQDWISIAIIAVLTIGGSLEQEPVPKSMLLMSAAVTAILGTLQIDHHWRTREYKIFFIIDPLEAKLGTSRPPREVGKYSWFNVQAALIVSYFALTGLYVTWLSYLLIPAPYQGGIIWPLWLTGFVDLGLFYSKRTSESIRSHIEMGKEQRKCALVTSVPPEGERHSAWIEPSHAARVTVVNAGDTISVRDQAASKLFIYISRYPMRYSTQSERKEMPDGARVMFFHGSEHEVEFAGLAYCLEARAPDLLLPEQPMLAKIDQLELCLRTLKEKPLKIIVPKMDVNDEKHRGFERKWTGGDWRWEPREETVARDVLEYPPDTVEFSVANEFTDQEQHRHSASIETFVPTNGIGVEVFSAGMKSTHASRDGAVTTLLPNCCHIVTLDSLTFVLQVSVGNNKISKDKELCEKTRNTHKASEESDLNRQQVP